MSHFPFLPGEGDRQSSREFALSDETRPPRYLMLTLQLLADGADADGPPPDTWLSEFENSAGSRAALRDIGADFGVHSTSFADGSVARWFGNDKSEMFDSAAKHKIWLGYARRVSDDVRSEGGPASAFSRISREWADWRVKRDAEDEHGAEERRQRFEDFCKQETWPLCACVMWIALRDLNLASRASEWHETFTDDWSTIAHIAAYCDSEQSGLTRLAPDGYAALMQACTSGRVKMLGVRDAALAQIDVRLLESGAIDIRETADREVRAYIGNDIAARHVSFDKASLFATFPARSEAEQLIVSSRPAPAPASASKFACENKTAWLADALGGSISNQPRRTAAEYRDLARKLARSNGFEATDEEAVSEGKKLRALHNKYTQKNSV